MRTHWCVPIDTKGSVIYFGINGRPFLFDGHSGTFYDALPEYAVEVLNSFLEPEQERPRILAALRKKHGKRCQAAMREIQLYRRGRHPNLSPEPKQKAFLQRLSPRIFPVYVSQTCNLACRYCVNQKGTFGGQHSQMQVETAQQLVAFVRAIVRSEKHPVVSVILFGGEPLLSRPALYILARGLQDLNRAGLSTRVHTVLSTNGTIYDEEIFAILAEQPDCNTVAVSLDAFKEVHDANRPFNDASKGSTYDLVVENLRKMIAAGIPHSVTCVVPYPYEYVRASEELHRLGIERLEIKPLIGHVFGKKDLPELFRDDLTLWREKYLEYCDYYLGYLKSDGRIKHTDRHSVLGTYSQALGDSESAGRLLGCGIADMKMSVAADGRILPCECFLGQNAAIGDVKTGINQARFEQFESWILSNGQFRVTHERCRNCYAKRVCGGGCYALTCDLLGRLEPLPESKCEFTRERLKIDLYFISRLLKENREFASPSNGDCP